MRQSSGVSRPVSNSLSREEFELRLWPRATRVERLAFRKAPLLFAAIGFALGEGITKLPVHEQPPAVILIAAVVLLAGLTYFALGRAPRLVLLPLAALWVAVGMWSAQLEPAPSPQTQLLPYTDGLSRMVQARVVRIRELPANPSAAASDFDADQWDEPGAPTLSVDLSLTAIEYLTPDISRMVPMSGGVRATVIATAARPLAVALHCGDVLEAPMRLRLPQRYRDPGAWQYADYLLDQRSPFGTAQGIVALSNLPAAKLRVLPGPARVPLADAFSCRIAAVQTWASSRLLGYTRSTPNRRLPSLLRLTPEDAGMIDAMLFGDRTRLTHALRLGFERTGSFHLFVVSGMHVALLAGLLLVLARRLRMPPVAATLMTLTITAGYALLTGFGVPIQRALLMTAVFLGARLLWRRPSSLNGLGAAALAVLIWSPRALFEASFQMTFLAIVAIAGIAIPLGERGFLPHAYAVRELGFRWKDVALPPRLAQLRVMLRLWGDAFAGVLFPAGKGRGYEFAAGLPATGLRVVLWAAELALIGLVAEAVMVLPMALYFHRATVFALPANLISVPLVAVLAPLALVAFAASLVSPWLAALPGAGTALLLHGIAAAIGQIGHIQAADLRVPGPATSVALAAAVCVGASCWAVRRSRALAWAAVALLPLAAALTLWPERPSLHSGKLEVTAIDVGQGDSLLLVGPTGQTMLVDAGGPTGAAANAENASTNGIGFDIGEEVVSPYLWSRRLGRLDVVTLTHAHSDHMGGMAAVLRNLRPRELWVSVDPDSAAYRDLLREAAALGTTVRHLRAGDRPAWDTVAISVLAPSPGYTNAGPPTNNDSLVLRVQFGKASVLLEGDAEAASEHTMVARSQAMADTSETATRLGPATLLKVGHHGSRTSSTPAFVELAAPRDAIISVGRQNTFGHPRAEVIQRLADAGAHVYRTDRFGLTTFLLSADGSISASSP